MNSFNKCAWSGLITLGIAASIDIYFKIDLMDSGVKTFITVLVLFSGVFTGMTFNASKNDAKGRKNE